MPMGSEKSDDADSGNRHEETESDHNEVEWGHDVPDDLYLAARRIAGRRLSTRRSRRGNCGEIGPTTAPNAVLGMAYFVVTGERR